MKFHNHNGENEVETLIAIMAKLPGLGPRSARRAVIRMLEKKEIILEPLAKILNLVTEKIKNCNQCGNFAIDSVCSICLLIILKKLGHFNYSFRQRKYFI